jgi:hypothetical protein
MSSCDCQAHECRRRPRGLGHLVRALASAAVLYVAAVFAGGTLIHTGHPVAEELGHLIHVVTFVDPAIQWAETRGIEPLSTGLRIIANGIPIGQYV